MYIGNQCITLDCEARGKHFCNKLLPLWNSRRPLIETMRPTTSVAVRYVELVMRTTYSSVKKTRQNWKLGTNTDLLRIRCCSKPARQSRNQGTWSHKMVRGGSQSAMIVLYWKTIRNFESDGLKCDRFLTMTVNPYILYSPNSGIRGWNLLMWTWLIVPAILVPCRYRSCNWLAQSCHTEKGILKMLILSL